MKYLIPILLVILFIGPLRRPYLRHARFTIPATIGFLLGTAVGAVTAELAGLPPFAGAVLAWALSIGLAASLGGAFKGWCDRTFGPKEDPHDRR